MALIAILLRFSGLFVSLKGSARSRVLLKVFPKPWRCSSLCDSSQPAELLHWAPENQTLMPDDSWERRTFRLDFLTLVRGPCCPPSSEGFPKLGRLMWLSPLYVFCLACNPPSQIHLQTRVRDLLLGLEEGVMVSTPAVPARGGCRGESHVHTAVKVIVNVIVKVIVSRVNWVARERGEGRSDDCG